jgi:hypothetical protein
LQRKQAVRDFEQPRIQMLIILLSKAIRNAKTRQNVPSGPLQKRRLAT